MAVAVPANISSIQDAADIRWLAEKLGPARARVGRLPQAEALARIRARVFGEAAAPKQANRRAA